MKKNCVAAISFIIILIPAISCAQADEAAPWYARIGADYKNFYSAHQIWQLALGIGYAGLYANTSFDQEIQNCYADYFQSRATDNMSKIVKPIGNGRIMVPIYLAAVLAGGLAKDNTIGAAIGDWGAQCSRAILVGAPPVLALQRVLGASRPEDGRGSSWHHLHDDNGVSGHSFMGAVPFLVAAKMTDNRFLKYPLYLGSTLTGLSRINDNKHYFSQVFLGWWIAFLSVDSIDKNKIFFAPATNGIGAMIYFYISK